MKYSAFSGAAMLTGVAVMLAALAVTAPAEQVGSAQHPSQAAQTGANRLLARTDVPPVLRLYWPQPGEPSTLDGSGTPLQIVKVP